ncbi:MAG: succinyl-diaminopimelate desuccinylase [Acidimicrobiaceae bacterium]|jgi:succinyl-diaminopimelate desuccinylase
MSADLLARTAELIDIPSVSQHEQAITDRIESELRAAPWLTVDRLGDNVIARTTLDRPLRVVIAGHTDTVPVNENDHARIDGDTVWGLGASDMKSGLAVMLDLATTVDAPAVDVTYVFYAGEEIAAEHNGLAHVMRDQPELLRGDVAILGEPTGAEIEAGCQGTLRLDVTLTGVRAHSARPWMGRNAIHRLGRLLAILEGWEGRQPVVDGCEYREAVQAVLVEGGVAGNVVPDRARVVINHRFAPDRDEAAAEAWLRELIAPALEEGDTAEVVDSAAGARPGLDHPLLAALIERNGLEVRAKLGWTDVARFSALAMPAVNLGPGDPVLAHTAGEFVTRAQLERTWTILRDLLVSG